MDWSHFGMTRRPFCPAVDTGAYFPAATHEAATAGIVAAFARRDPVVLLDGQPGTGKSLVVRRWLEQLPAAVPRVLLPNIHATRPADLLQAILFDLSKPYQGLTEQELRLGVTAVLLAATEHPVVMVVDEAQHLSHAAIEELRLLGNIETHGGSALFVVLIALPSLRDALARPAYEAFAQRVGVSGRVEPFSADEAAQYIRHQVKAAGGDPRRVFDEDAVTLVAGATGGIARVLNRAATLAAELAAGAGASKIDVEAALEALTSLGIAPADDGELGQPVSPAHPDHTAEPARPARSRGGRVRGSATGAEQPTAQGSKQKSARKRSA